ncbi:MAG: hypothetical protein ACXVP0_15655 [Bacteroidia bacterium]
MKTFTLKAVLIAGLVFTFNSCKKSKEIVTLDMDTSTDIVVNLTGVQKWAYVEFTGSVRPNLQSQLDGSGIKLNDVGEIQQTNFTIVVKNPTGKKIQDYTWFGNYEYWMSVPDLDGVECCNKTEYRRYIAAGNSWNNVTATNCNKPPCSSFVIGGNYKGYVSEDSYTLRMRCWLNDTVPTTPTTTLTINQHFKVKAIK